MSSASLHDPFGAITPIPWSDFRARVLELYQPPLRSRTTFISVRKSLDLLEASGPLETTADLNTATIGRFVTSRVGEENPNTTRHHLRKLSAVASIAVGEGWLRVNPFSIRRQWVRGVTPASPRVHSIEEISRVLTLARQEIFDAHPAARWKSRRLYALASTVAYCGLRATEALTLRVEDVHLAGGFLALTARPDFTLKTPGAAAPVPIPDPLLPILRGWLAYLGPCPWVFPTVALAGPWRSGSEANRPVGQLKALGERAGVPGLTFLSLRHSWATQAELWGLSELQVARILRHTTTQTQKTYRHASVENMRAMVKGVTFDPITLSAGPPAAAELPAIAGPTPPAAVPRPPVDGAMVEYREPDGCPRHRVGSDRSVWTNLRRAGHERPGDPPGPWRRLLEIHRKPGDAAVVNLRRDGKTVQRTVRSLMRECFGIH